MTTLIDILAQQNQTRLATDAGVRMHARLQRVLIDDKNTTGNPEIVARIKAHPEMVEFFGPKSRPEVPIAGTINGQFISRRIDRLYINDETKQIVIIDYKTDVDTDRFYSQYVEQINEYALMLHYVYPGYEISGYILWTRDFVLEPIEMDMMIC